MRFEQLRDLVELDIEYTAKTALAVHAGKGTAFETVDQPVIMSAGKPIIPGSSIKGALRSTLEAMLAGLGHQVCVPAAALHPRRLRRREEQQEYAKQMGRLMPCADVASPCPVCSIFGTASQQAGLAGKALFMDATAVEGKYELIERSHVAITRDTRSQSEGSLMSLQAVDAGAVFWGKIRLVNADPWEVGAIFRALEGVEFMGMGAKKTAGYGSLEIKVKQIEIIRFDGANWQRTPAEKEPYLEAFTHKFGA